MRRSGPILVPLDGSELAEGALPWAATLAQALGAPLALLTVWQGTESELGANFPAMAVEVEAKARDYFAGYLDSAKAKLPSGVQCETIIRSGEAGDEILRAAEELRARTVVIATHGRSGVGRWVYGSTAGHILRHTSLPVLAVGPHALASRDAMPRVQHIMVPLDGAAASESAIPIATDLAAQLRARISLVRVVRWAVQAYPYTLPDAYVPQVDDELEAGAKAYLREQEGKLAGSDVSGFVVRGAIADGLIEFAEKEAVDLTLMTTHARTGLARMALGSVADRVLQGPAPVLLIRPEQA